MSLEPQAAADPLALGKALREQGRDAEAEPHLRAAAEAAPDDTEAQFELGISLLLQHKAEAAEAEFRRVLELDPQHQLALLNLGNALNHLSRWSEAAGFYRRALDAGQPFAMGFNNLGKALQSQGRLAEAIAAYERGLALDPDGPLLLGNLSSAFQAQGHPERMAERCQSLLAANPDSFQAQLNLCIARRLEGKLDAAIEAGRRAVELDVNSAPAHFHLGHAWHDKQRLHDAVVCFQNALEADAAFTPAHNMLAGTLNVLGKLDEALDLWTRAVEISPDFDAAHSNRLLCLNYDASRAREALAKEHLAWGRRVVERVGQPAPHTNDRDPARPLRVGYVSADFRGHPVAAFAEPVLATHDRERVEVTCYSASTHEDAVTARFKTYAARWRDVAKLTDEALAARIREDAIDVLVDLSGHTGGTRLGVFARKPAPVQVTWIGYPNTTGLPTMDWRLTDAYADPPGQTEALHSEALARLPKSFLCFRPPDSSPPVRPLPPSAEGYFTFGAFNNLVKVGPQGVAAWARILQGLPTSRLLIKNSSLADDRVRARLEGMFAAHGVSAARLELMGRVGHQAHLALYNQVGLHLDPFPYAGTATTFEASWMGVPTLTLAGDRHAARVGVSHNRNLGVPELVCASVDDYVARAIELGGDHDRLATLKAGYRDRLAASPLMNAAATARALERLFGNMFREWSLC